jgi:hypothetical protein
VRPRNPRELRSGQGGTFRFRPATRWGSVTGLVKKRDGTTVEEPTPTVDTVDTTIATYASATGDQIKVDDATGIERGVVYLVTDNQWGEALVEVSSVDGQVLTLAEPLPATPEASSTFQGLEVSMDVAAISDRDVAYRAIVRGPEAGQEEVARFDVVYQPWSDPLRAQDVRRYLARIYPNDPILQDEERMSDVAQKACDHVRTRLRGSDRYAHRYFDSSDLMEPCEAAMRRELALKGLLPGNVDPAEYIRSMEFDIRDRIGDILRSSIPYDADDSGSLDSSEANGIWSGSLTR